MVLETEEDMLVIDCGLMFPDDYLLGVDVVIPRVSIIFWNTRTSCSGIILTHGHEDHIGALALADESPGYTACMVRVLLWPWRKTGCGNTDLDKYTTFHSV